MKDLSARAEDVLHSACAAVEGGGPAAEALLTSAQGRRSRFCCGSFAIGAEFFFFFFRVWNTPALPTTCWAGAVACESSSPWAPPRSNEHSTYLPVISWTYALAGLVDPTKCYSVRRWLNAASISALIPAFFALVTLMPEKVTGFAPPGRPLLVWILFATLR